MAETNCTVFLEGLPPEKKAEGLGVQVAILAGECFVCEHYARCCTDAASVFPENAACMVHRDKILKEWGLEGKKDG